MLTNEDKNQILISFLETIENISDKKYQKRVWIEGRGPEADDFEETVCYFFGIGDPILKKYKKYDITQNQYKMLKKFRDEFEAFSDEHDWPQLFIDTPEWEKIMEMAKEVLAAFNYKRKINEKIPPLD